MPSTGLSQEPSSTWKPIASIFSCMLLIDDSSEASLPVMKLSVCMGCLAKRRFWRKE